LPAGSHGVGFETDEMARIAGLQARWTGGRIVDPKRSAGPASCVLFACAPEATDEVIALLDDGRPAQPVARLTPPD